MFSLRIFELPELARDAKGRALVNILEFEPGEKVADCRSVSGFEDPNQFLMLATRGGMVKKTALEQYRRRRTKGLIAVKLREGDELVDAVITKPGDELVHPRLGACVVTQIIDTERVSIQLESGRVAQLHLGLLTLTRSGSQIGRAHV